MVDRLDWRFREPRLRRLAGLDVLITEFVWAFDPDTGEALGTLQMASAAEWRTGIWTHEGLRPGPIFNTKFDALEYIRNRAKESGQCTSTSTGPPSATSPETPS